MKKLMLVLATGIIATSIFSQQIHEAPQIQDSDEVTIHRKVDSDGKTTYSWDNVHISKTADDYFDGFKLINNEPTIIDQELAKHIFTMYDDLFHHLSE